MTTKYIKCYSKEIADKLSEAIFELTRPDGNTTTKQYFAAVEDVDNIWYLPVNLETIIPIAQQPQIDKFTEILDFFEDNGKISHEDRQALIAKVEEKQPYPLGDFLDLPTIDLLDSIELPEMEAAPV